jgi:acyl-CoA thioesterase YciA
MMPRDTNGMGDIFGGVIMSQVDIAGAITAHAVCDNRIVTRVCTVEFISPVLVNDILTCWGRVQKVGNTSIAVTVDVEVERRGRKIRVGQATLVFVAVDDKRRPTPIKLRHGVSRTRMNGGKLPLSARGACRDGKAGSRQS